MTQTPTLFSNRNFGLLWLASIIGNFALAIAMMAETWYVVKTLGAKEQLGWVMIAGSVPRIALMAVGGVLADRMSRSRIILISLALRVVLLFSLVGLLHINRLDIWALTIFAFLYGSLDAFFWPARDTLTPAIVADSDLTRANSIMLTTNQVGMVFGPVMGGAMLALMGYEAIFSLTGGMLLLATLCIALISEPVIQVVREAPSMLKELKEGVVYALQTPILRALMLIYITANLLFMGPLALGIPIIVADYLKGDASTLSYLQSAFAAGMVLGGILLTVYPPSKKRLLMITVIIAIEGVLLSLLPLTPWIWAAVALQFFIGMGVAGNNVPMMSLIQQSADRDKLGRVMSLNNMVSMGLSPVSYAMVTALLAAQISITWIMPMFGLTMALVMLVLTLQLKVIRTAN
ncbi:MULTISPECIES: MFS transporter [Deefgea]|uniref:MFS transporter n=1 Tax=Deefgea chitinilytica TaxID=570276 RepID=A0ABS2CAU5_9NEIS|nr:MULTISPECIES: MFS transporter [Deefgea]MBM5571278.1 MFS transporter [Deefgea chitinilytica]MBM9888510.1 MFS transporter [Deefgea sp. CFH1-16]